MVIMFSALHVDREVVIVELPLCVLSLFGVMLE